jgi:hypothetical protein
MFGGLIPENHCGAFVNQGLDPYLQCLYLKFGAAPFLEEARLRNNRGGNDTNLARYSRIPTFGWRDWVLHDVSPICQYLEEHSILDESPPPIHLVDVVVPTYCIESSFLEVLCSLEVPQNFRTTFIIVVDNPSKLLRLALTLKSSMADKDKAAQAFEQHLTNSSKLPSNDFLGNNICVRCNPKNLGASASRNKGIEESSAEYVLFLDDDVIHDVDLLKSYGTALGKEILNTDCELVGLVGLIRFPCSSSSSKACCSSYELSNFHV